MMLYGDVEGRYNSITCLLKLPREQGLFACAKRSCAQFGIEGRHTRKRFAGERHICAYHSTGMGDTHSIGTGQPGAVFFRHPGTIEIRREYDPPGHRVCLPGSDRSDHPCDPIIWKPYVVVTEEKYIPFCCGHAGIASV